MAKRCEVCKQTYSDKEPTCPYCATAIDIVVEEEAPVPVEVAPEVVVEPDDTDIIEVVEDSGVQLISGSQKNLAKDVKPEEQTQTPGAPEGRPARPETGTHQVPQPETGTHQVPQPETGAHKISEPETGTHQVPQPETTMHKIPRPAPATRLASKSPAPTMLAPAGAEDEILDVVPETAAASKEQPPAKPAAPKAPDAADSKKTRMAGKVGQPTQLASKAPAPTMLAPSDEEILGVVPEDRAHGPATPEPQAKHKAAQEAAKPPTEEPAASDIMEMPSDEVIVEGESEVNLGGPDAGHERPSGLDLIAEAVESGVDLGGPPHDPPTRPQITPADEAEEAAAAALSDDSSAVNLGTDSGVRSPFDQDYITEPDSGRTVQGESVEEEIGVVDDEEEAAAAAEEKEEPAAVGAGAGKPPRRNYVPWAGGILAGLLLAGAAGGGAWYAGLLKVGKGDEDAAKRANTGLRFALNEKDQKLTEADKAVKEANQKLRDAQKETEKAVGAAVKKAKDDAAKALEPVKKEKDDAVKERDAQKAAREKAAADLKTASDQVTKLSADLKAAQDGLTKTKADLTTLTADKTKLEAERKKLADLVTLVRTKLREGKYLAPNAETDELLVAGLDKVLKQAVSPLVSAVGQLADSFGTAGGGVVDTLAQLYDLGSWTAQREARLAYYKGREPMIHSPEKMLGHWIALLNDRDRSDAGELAKIAARDAQWVIQKDDQASPETKAKAKYVLALALRNQLSYAGARANLDEALAGPAKPEDAAWRAEAQKVRTELTDVLAYQLRFRQLASAGKPDKALAELAAGLKAASGKEKGSLLAFQSLIRLARARQSGKKLTPTMPGVEEARKDAQAAIADGAETEGNFALGRVAEELGDLETAAKHYAVAAKYTGRKELASLYRLALARVLLRIKPESTEEKKEEKDSGKKTKAQNGSRPHSRAALAKRLLSPKADHSLSPAAMLLVLNTVLVQGGGDDDETPVQNPNVDRAIQLAREVIDLGDPQGYLLLGSALTQKGEWTKGLMEYINGLEKLYPGQATMGLRALIEEHPAFRTPESVKPPQPLLAEKHYSLGLNYYWARQYAKAETEFQEAVKCFGKDARYQYFLGLARIMQNQQAKVAAALENFRQGKRLEDQGSPDASDVGTALEKVQGRPRKILDRYREP
jgi:hypothetical protein